MNDEYDEMNNDRAEKYDWFLHECLDKEELIKRVKENDYLGKQDGEFEDYLNL